MRPPPPRRGGSRAVLTPRAASADVEDQRDEVYRSREADSQPSQSASAGTGESPEVSGETPEEPTPQPPQPEGTVGAGMPKVAEHMQPKRAAKRPKAPKTGSIGQGGVDKSPGVIKLRGHGRGYTTVGNLDTERSAQEVHNPRNGSKAVLLRGACSPAIGPNQGGQNEQDRNFCTPDIGGQGGVARYRDCRCREAGKQPQERTLGSSTAPAGFTAAATTAAATTAAATTAAANKKKKNKKKKKRKA